MEGGSWVGPAVIAAFVSGVVSVVGLIVNRWTTVTMHRDRLATDVSLAQKKVDADISLAERKFALDQRQAVQSWRFELAEAVLADAYRFRDLMLYVRNGFTREGEGESRTEQQYENDALKKNRNSYFVPVERLRDNGEFISSMMARRYAAQSHFGQDAARAYDLFHEVTHRVRIASSMLIDMAGGGETDRDLQKQLRADVWAGYGRVGGGDELGSKIDEAMTLVEGFCRPALERQSVAA